MTHPTVWWQRLMNILVVAAPDNTDNDHGHGSCLRNLHSTSSQHVFIRAVVCSFASSHRSSSHQSSGYLRRSRLCAARTMHGRMLAHRPAQRPAQRLQPARRRGLRDCAAGAHA